MQNLLEEHAKKYPEHQKLRAIHNQSRSIGSFLEYLEENGHVLCKYDSGTGEYEPVRTASHSNVIQALLAEYFEIDLRVIDDEKRAMLDDLEKSRVEEENNRTAAREDTPVSG